MNSILAIARYTYKEHIRHKIALSSALFGLILITAGFITSTLAQDERARTFLDLGLAANEAIALISIVFLTVHLILQEIESRSVFLILTHPVKRWHYLIGRFAGTLAAVSTGLFLMGIVHWAILKALGWTGDGSYALAWFCTFGKTAMMGALALFLSLALTSEAAAMSFSVFFWIMGHFSAEMKFVAEKSGNVLIKSAILLFSHTAPNFSFFNYRDAWHAGIPEIGFIQTAFLYMFAYVFACLALATQVFEQKEF